MLLIGPGRWEAFLVDFRKKIVCFATGRARNFPLILVDVLPREVVEILATKSGWTAKSTLSLRRIHFSIQDGPHAFPAR